MEGFNIHVCVNKHALSIACQAQSSFLVSLSPDVPAHAFQYCVASSDMNTDGLRGPVLSLRALKKYVSIQVSSRGVMAQPTGTPPNSSIVISVTVSHG